MCEIGRQHACEGAAGSRDQSISDLTRPTQPMMSETNQHTGDSVRYSLRIMDDFFNVLQLRKCALRGSKTGPMVYRPYPRRLGSLTNLQMQLQKQRFPLSYLKTVSVGVARVRTHDLPNQLSQPVGAWPFWLSESSRHISTGHE